MSENLDKRVLEVAGLPSNKKVIKFKGDDTWYDISENVQKYDLVKYGIVAGAVVDVTFDEKKMVIYLKVKEGAKAEEPVKEAEPTEPVESPQVESSDNLGETLVIQGVANNKKVLKFKGQAGWSQISDELQGLDYDAVGYKAGNTVTVTFNDKGVIVGMVVVANPEPEQSYSNDNYNNDAVSNSIEAQVAWKGAVDIVVASISCGQLPASSEEIAEMLEKLTSVGITAIANR